MFTPVASKELKHFKDSVQDSSRKARLRSLVVLTVLTSSVDNNTMMFSSSAVDEAVSSVLSARMQRKKRVLVNEKGMPLVRDKSESPFAEKLLHNMKPSSGKIRRSSAI
ncbi:hypothetical protein SDJN03_27505, partial [Cucurbita argyrosperma subsp. sororia]